MSSLEAPLPSWANLSLEDCTSSLQQHDSYHTCSRDSQDYSQAGECQSRSSRGSRGPRPRLFGKGRCQADACSASLTALPFYYQRNHICMEHSKCQTFNRHGAEVRYCQRCGFAHPLTDFDGARRSCRRQLDRHNTRRRRLAATARGASSSAPSSTRSRGGDPMVLDPAFQELPAVMEGPASSTGSGASFVASAGERDERICPRVDDCADSGCCSSRSLCLGGGGNGELAGGSHATAAPARLVRGRGLRLDDGASASGRLARDGADDDGAVSSAYTGLDGAGDGVQPIGAGVDALGDPRLHALNRAETERALAALQRGHSDAYGFLVAHQLQLAGLLMTAARVVVHNAAANSMLC